MEYWCIIDDFKPQWVRDLMDRKLLIHHSTPVSDCYEFRQTLYTTSPIYLYDGDGLCFYNNTIGVVYNLYYKSFEELRKDIPVIKYYCDMCGKEIFNKNNIYEVKLSKKNNDYNAYIDIDDSIKKDICENCYNKIKDMLKRRVKD